MHGLPPDISSILSRYSRQFAGQDFVAATPHAGFSGARVWRLETTHAVWALRRWPRNAFSPARLNGLHRLLSHLAKSGLSFVAVPVGNDFGATLTSDGSHDWQLEPWLSGAADFHAHPNAARLAAAMNALADWHRAAATFSPDSACRSWFASQASATSPAVRERLQLWRESQPALSHARSSVRNLPPADWRELCEHVIALVEQLGSIVAAELARFQNQTVPLQPCLRDIWHDHVLFTGDAVTGLIDPSACRSENVAADLARLLGSLIEDDAAAWNGAIETYRQFRPLSIAEESLIGVLDRSGIVLSALTWLTWLFVERREFPSPAAVPQRLNTLHRRLVRLAQRL